MYGSGQPYLLALPHLRLITMVGQNHIYTVYIYDIRCIYRVFSR